MEVLFLIRPFILIKSRNQVLKAEKKMGRISVMAAVQFSFDNAE